MLLLFVKARSSHRMSTMFLKLKGGFAGDLMSDVLASIQSEAVLITGLCNPQCVRTALIADVRA
jgi:hypothetical protein